MVYAVDAWCFHFDVWSCFRFFPVRENLHTIQTEDLWRLLYKHVQSHYSSLKQAFLQFDSVSSKVYNLKVS